MSAFVMESDGELYLVCEGEEARLPLTDEPDMVRVPDDAPSWAPHIARDHGYTTRDTDPTKVAVTVTTN